MFAPYRLIASLIAVIAILGGTYMYGHHAGYKSASDAAAGRELAIAQSSARALHEANDKARATERTLQTIKDKLEVQNVQSQKAIDAVHAANIHLAATKRLRDPYHHTTSCRAVPKDTKPTSSDTVAATGGQLSEELTNLLLSESYRADQAAIYAKTCHDWAMSVTGK